MPRANAKITKGSELIESLKPKQTLRSPIAKSKPKSLIPKMKNVKVIEKVPGKIDIERVTSPINKGHGYLGEQWDSEPSQPTMTKQEGLVIGGLDPDFTYTYETSVGTLGNDNEIKWAPSTRTIMARVLPNGSLQFCGIKGWINVTLSNVHKGCYLSEGNP